MLGAHKSLAATAANAAGSLRSGRLSPAVPHFGRSAENEASTTNMDLEALYDQAEEAYLIPCRRNDGTLDLHARAANGDTMLHVAVGRRDFSAIRYLLEAGLDVNAQGDYHETPIFSAAAHHDIGLVGFLLQMGADPSIPDHRGTLPAEALFSRLKRLPEARLLRLSQWISANLQDRTTQNQAEKDVTPNA